MTNPFNWSFNSVVSGYALFFKNDHTNGHALRLEIPKDSSTTTTFQTSSRTRTYHVMDDTVNGKTYAVIEFRRNPNDKAYAKFYAPDNHRVASAADMGNLTSTGTWITLKSASCYTTIEKKSNSRTVTATLTSVDKVASWDAGSTSFTPNAFKVNGYLHYKRLNKLNDAKYANYNNDRIVFYENDWTGRDFVGFFIPMEDAAETLGIQSTRSTPALTFQNVTWKDT
ncbi:hypothetical protein R3P38DRAFT_3347267 [Favolaschia claudopus]|uniref:Uncharacterized protein n=1 Tax=Favolaschia claudopus TaxID=2862362 RepID=A0AAW0D163_9AGAR